MSKQERPERPPYRSTVMKSGPVKAAARAMLRGLGLDDDDINQPFVGVASSQGEMSACNMRLSEVAEQVRWGIYRGAGRRARSTPSRYPTPWSTGTAGCIFP
ncbi:hypothetical protein [Kineobactrum salinum]|uniref:hypothetical protein n=1 Tax=Kineobactrum salinum TaxID=2708301 RepID=UPI001E41CC30|nr:hypothetical protein [Kineobactrum salinum]